MINTMNPAEMKAITGGAWEGGCVTNPYGTPINLPVGIPVPGSYHPAPGDLPDLSNLPGLGDGFPGEVGGPGGPAGPCGPADPLYCGP